MGTLQSARRIIGNLFSGTQQPAQAQPLAQTGVTAPPPTPPSAPAPGQPITINVPAPQPLSVGTMTPEQLRTRRMHQIENASIGKSPHVRFFLYLVKCWLFIGPPWYVLLTTSEVGWALSRHSFNWTDQTSINFYSGALFIELGMMFTTFFLAYLRHLQAESEGQNQTVNTAVTGLVVIWVILALVSAAGQFYYLFNASSAVTGASPDPFHVAFVVTRVFAFSVVDFATAFYLSRIQTSLDELMAANRKKGNYYVEMSTVDSELMRKESDAAVQVEQAQADLNDRRKKNQLSNRILTIAVDAALREIQKKFNPDELPPPDDEDDQQPQPNNVP